MALVDELLQPIAGESPSGADLRYTPVYDNIREARREDDNLNQGAWQHDRKAADWQQVVRIATDAIKNRSKDLQIAAWLTEAWLHRDGFAGLQQGLILSRGLIETFWESLYPQLEDGDSELRASPLDWIGTKLDATVRMVPISASGYGFYRYRESRTVQYEDQAKDNVAKKAREKALAEGKLAPEVFDKDFNDTPKAFYAGAEKNLDASIVEIGKLGAICDEKFKEDGPTFGKLKTTLEEVRHVIHALLQKKRETDPDPVEETPVIEVAAPTPQGAEAGEQQIVGSAAPTALAGSLTFNVANSSESAARQALVAQVAGVAATLRLREPLSPAPYLLLRGLRWGELRAAASLADPNFLEAPPTEVRQHIKRLANAEKWKELLEVAEAAMALPCSRAWLDLQRLIVEALTALGPDYDAIAIAIRSELRALLRDLPQLLHATLLDDTPAANDQTRAWLLTLLSEPSDVGKDPGRNGSNGNGAGGERGAQLWQKRFVDSNALAKEALRSGQESRAFEILHHEISTQTSARGRFHRRLQFVELCLAAGKEAIAQPLLEDLLAAIEAHKLEEWEERSSIAGALITIMKASKKIQGDAKEKQKYFERICRLDPVQALSC